MALHLPMHLTPRNLKHFSKDTVLLLSGSVAYREMCDTTIQRLLSQRASQAPCGKNTSFYLACVRTICSTVISADLERPHEKGGLEHDVGYVRRHTCVPVPDVPNLEAFNAHLLSWCTKQRDKRWSMWEQERAALRPLPVHPHRCTTTHPVVVNKLCLVSFDHNRYSVPSIYVGKIVILRAYAEKIEVVDRDRVIATHQRCHERKHTPSRFDHKLFDNRNEIVGNEIVDLFLGEQI